MSRIIVKQNDSEFEIVCNASDNLLSVLRSNGISIPAACGGRGKCGKCRLKINGVPRLSCKYEISDGDTVELPEGVSGVVLSESNSDTEIENGRSGLAAGVDLGTTTIAVKLIDLSNGKELSIVTAWNKQSSYGSDVISRIQYVMDNDGGLKTLSELVRDQVYELISEAVNKAERSISELREIYVAGNTVMQHIFAGISPNSIAVSPFKPLSLFDDYSNDSLNGINITYSQCIAGYVGGDISAGMLNIKMDKASGKNLFLDIGTNGEMALGDENGVVCCAVASGPAFEGAGIECGMPGIEGAISHVKYSNGFLFDVIGSGKPKGICGSGLVDLVAVLLELGIIEESGRMLPPKELPKNLSKYVEEDENGNGRLRINDEVYLSAADVRNLQLAKAAVAAGIEVLLEYKNINYTQIDSMYIAGGFGNYIDKKSAVRIGMLPSNILEKTKIVGNTSLGGICDIAKNSKNMDVMKKICSISNYIELSGNKLFNEYYMENMSF